MLGHLFILYSRRSDMSKRSLAKITGCGLLLVFIVTFGTGCAMTQQMKEDREAAEAAMKAAETAAARVEAAADRVEAAADRAEAAAARSERAAVKAERIFQQGLRK
jgi:sensor c-di-GMP phosphodiesterase-like protein